MQKKPPQRILVVRTDRIGDVVLTTPMITQLRSAFPQAFISLLVSPVTYSLVYGNPCLDEIIVDDLRGAHKGFWGFWKLAWSLRRRRYDCVLVLHSKRRTHALCFCAGIPRRIGYKNNKFGFLLTEPLVDQRHLGKKHEACYCLELLSVLGIHPPKEPAWSLSVSVDSAAERWADECIRSAIGVGRKIIAIHPGASDSTRYWPAESFAAVIDRFPLREKCSFVLIGTADLGPIGRTIVANARGHIVNLIGQTTVSQMVSILKRSHMLLSNDSGPMHIAAALNVGVVAIFVRNQPGINPERWRPLGPRSCFVSVPASTRGDFCKAGKARDPFSPEISPGAVLECIDALFKLC